MSAVIEKYLAEEHAKGYAEGFIKGSDTAKKAVIKNLMASGKHSVEEIASIVNLSVEIVKAFARENS